jgi:putative photosynthetic complex assembly protein
MSNTVADSARSFHPMALVLIGMALSTLVLVSLARWSGAPVEQFDSPVTTSRALRFEDTPTGAVAVLDPANGAEISRFEGEQGFVRGVLRAIARERKRRSVDHQLPLLLQGHADGSLTLDDPATGERIHLESFGPTQRATFAALQTTPAPSTEPKSKP